MAVLCLAGLLTTFHDDVMCCFMSVVLGRVYVMNQMVSFDRNRKGGGGLSFIKKKEIPN